LNYTRIFAGMPAGCAALDQARSIDDGFSLA